MDAMPSHLIKLRILAEVPRSQYMGLTQSVDFVDTKARLGFLKLLRQPKPVANQKLAASKQIRKVEFNAAIWLNFSCPPKRPVSFWLNYQDQEGRKSVLVDEQTLVSATSAMLSGNVQLTVKGELEYLKACCGGVSDEEMFRVDELHVQQVSLTDRLSGSVANLDNVRAV